ncbi:glycerophosphodiester phosphodiesterase [Microbacterium sp. NPDC057944]|uniref:glycerophosphodiester phosphodiesterase n=1 Tax=Microbacterium sp. NPDC057944 TaxID=3346286 RepID=UPI0036DF37FD
MAVFGTPAFGGTSTAVNSFSISKPVDLVDGQVLLLFATDQESSTAVSWTVPAGFTLFSAPSAGPSSTRRYGGMWWKSVSDAAAEPASYTVQNSASRKVGMLIPWTPDAPGTLEGVGYGTFGGDTVAAATASFNGRTLSKGPAISFAAFAAECTAGISHAPTTPPVGYTMLGNAQNTLNTSTTGSRTALWVGYRVEDDTTADGASATFTGASSTRVYTGSLTGGATVPVTYPAGFSSVTAMLATPGATWAHRGGSANWPEMSAYAYEQAVLAGYGALEVSAQRTSDGVLVCLHDSSPNRTSQTTGLPDVSAMTWAQLQGYQNTLNSAGTPRPYMRLVDFLDRWTPTHVVIVDNKTNTNQTEFLDLLDAHGGPSKIVVKAYGVGTGGGIASSAAARGYQTWGYFYEADAALLTANQGSWSILGMEYAAAAGTWASILSFGKPVVGHIAASQANYNTAHARGARAVQVSNVAGVVAVGASARVAPGALAMTGTAGRSIGMARTGTGAVALSGAAFATVGVERESAGTIELTATGQATFGVTRDAAGVLVFAGAAAVSIGVTRDAVGTVELAGAAAFSVNVAVAGEGALLLDGLGLLPARSRLRFTDTPHRLSDLVERPRPLPPPVWQPML